MSKQPITDFNFTMASITSYARNNGLQPQEIAAARKAAELEAMTVPDPFTDLYRRQIDLAIDSKS